MAIKPAVHNVPECGKLRNKWHVEKQNVVALIILRWMTDNMVKDKISIMKKPNVA